MARKRAFTPEDIYLLKNVSDPNVSPDGKSVAYVVSWADREKDQMCSAIYVAAMDGRSPARRFTEGTKDHSPRWSPDGRFLAFVAERGEKNQVFLAPLDGGEAKQLTKAPHGAGAPAWSRDGKRIAYAGRAGRWKETKERSAVERNAPRVIRDLRYKMDGIGFYDSRRMHIFTVDVETGKSKQITNGDYNDEQPAWSPDGRLITFVSDRERERHQRHWRTDVWVVSSTGGTPRKITRSTGSCSHPTFSPDGRTIAFLGHEYGDEGLARNIHVMVAPANGRGAPRSVSERLDRSAWGWPVFMAGRSFDWVAKSDRILFIAGDRGRLSIYATSARARTAPRRVLDGERQITGFGLAPDGKRLAFCAAWVTEPSEIYATNLTEGSKETNLSHANDDVREQASFGTLERMEYTATDGTRLEGFVMYPPDYRPGRRYPLAVNVHGGPHSFHPGAGYLSEFQTLASAGYVQLLPNPRGSTTYGEEFTLACVRDWGGGDFEDIMDGVDELILRGVADPDRLYIGGYSYGGFMSSWAIGHTDRFRASVVGAPVSNQLSMFGTGDIPHFDMYEIGGTPQNNPDEWWLRSPVRYLGNATTPVLLLHWEGDLRCPVAQSEEIFHALKVQGKEVEFVRYPGGFHTWNTHAPSQSVDRVRRTLAWYQKHAPRRKKAPARKIGASKAKALARA
jgi:dipeptidyl aminopeptidase/acylaminoacyl peptidase